jgi:NADH-quinone oxidoreductase subunit M
MAHLLSVLVAAPAAGALLLAVLPGPRVGLVRLVTCAASALTLLLALPLWLSFQPRGAQWQFLNRADVAGWPYLVGVDGFGVGLVLLIAILGVVAALLLTREPAPRVRASSVAVLLMETGVLGALVSLELRQMFAFWQLAVLALVALTMLSGARRAAVVGIALVVVGAAGMLSGLLALGEQYQSLASVSGYDVREFQTMPVPRPVQMQAFVLLALACVTPFVLLALYGWSFARRGGELAGGMVASTGIAVLAIFGFLRFVLPVMPQAARAFAPAMMITAGVAAVLALATAARSRGRVAIHRVGLALVLLAMVGVFAATPNALTGAAIQLAAASLMVAALVPLAGSPYFEYARRNALTFGIALVAVGVGFSGERLLRSGLAGYGQAAAYAILLVTAAAMVVIVANGILRASEPVDAGGRSPFDIPIAALPGAVMLAGVIYSGALFARLETSVARVVVRVSPEYASQVADCLNQPPPPAPAGSGLPPGAMLAAPCTDASGAGDPAVKR